MAQTNVLVAEKRTETGKGIARALRRGGEVPAVIYGHGREPEALKISRAELDRILAAAGASTVIELKLGGKKLKTLIREVQRHPTRLDVLHVDFLEIHAGEKLTVRAPIRLVGSPEGVRNQGGVLDQVLRDVEIRVLPRHLPESVELDVTDLTVGHSLHVSDIEIPNAEILDDPESTVCTVVPPRVEVEPVVVLEEEEEEALEPELIRKPRVEEEEEAAEAEPESGSPEQEG
ncbi:MAG: 50S ribosomal protein L25 [Gemmatimonadota bacterium]|nr:MAG: 50S ribosomal protein L25 [Gemmatimonadota bacterium]